MGLRELAETYLGAVIPPAEWDEAKAAAERKLDWIISREGDLDGGRREPWYLAQLIAEAVSARQLSRFTHALMANLEAKEKPAT